MAWEATVLADVSVGVFQSSGSQLTDRQVFTLVPAGVALIGLVFWYVLAKGPITRARRLFGVEPFDPRGDGTGLSAVSGPVEVADGTVTAPLTEAECVAYEHEQQSYRYTYKWDKDRRSRMRRRDDEDWDERVWSWETDSANTDRIPFRVETDHGPITVDPDGAHVEMPVEADEKTGRLKRAFYAANPLTGQHTVMRRLVGLLPFSGALTPSRPQRDVVRHLDPGETALVIGDVTAPDASDSDTAGRMSDATDPEMYRITTKSLWRLRVGAVWQAITASFVGLLALGLAGAVVYAGIIQGVY